MRYSVYPTRPDPDVRTRTWFALLPVSDGIQIRWLERVTAKQIWVLHPEGCHGYWETIAFLN